MLCTNVVLLLFKKYISQNKQIDQKMCMKVPEFNYFSSEVVQNSLSRQLNNGINFSNRSELQQTSPIREVVTFVTLVQLCPVSQRKGVQRM